MSRRAAALGLWLGAATFLWGCSPEEHHPTAPQTPLPEVTPGTMVARINGSPWGPSGVFAMEYDSGPMGPHTSIDAWATDLLLDLVIPRDLSVGTTYPLGASLDGIAIVARRLGPGHQVSGTGPGQTGAVTITQVDANHVAGTFHFDAGGDAGTFHVTEGTFDAQIFPDSLTWPSPAAVRARRAAGL